LVYAHLSSTFSTFFSTSFSTFSSSVPPSILNLGLVLEEVRSGELKAKLQREGVARSFKNLIRAELRQCGGEGREAAAVSRQKRGQLQHIELVLEWFNAILRGPAILQQRVKATDAELAIVKEIWERVLPEDIAQRFGSVFLANMTSLALTAEPHRLWIVNYLINSIGITVTPHCREHKLVSDELCPRAHALSSRVPAPNSTITCGNCNARANGNVKSCVACNFDLCLRCAGTLLTSFTKEDVIGFEPRKKFMSFMNAINAQLLSDNAILLVKSMAETRQAEFLNLMQQVTALCENLLRTDPTCVPIKEQLRYARMAVSVLEKTGTAIERRSIADTFLRSLLTELNNNTGNTSDGLKLMIAAGAIGQLQLVAKATRYQNLAPLRALTDEGGEIGNAVGYALNLGNRGAVALLLHEMKRRYSEPPPFPEVHLLRKKMYVTRRVSGVKYMYCTSVHSSRLICIEPSCSPACEHKYPNISQTSHFLSSNCLHFHKLLDLSVHPHILTIQVPVPQNQLLACTMCKRTQMLWHCHTCALDAQPSRFAVCSDCIEPDAYSHPHPVLAPVETGMVDDAMLATLSWGLRDNHAFSTLRLVECAISANGASEFFRQSRFASCLTSLDFSGNALDTTGDPTLFLFSVMRVFVRCVPISVCLTSLFRCPRSVKRTSPYELENTFASSDEGHFF